MGRSRKGGRRKREYGFSGPRHRWAWGPITRGAGISGREKRQFFNQISAAMILAAGLVGALFGYSLLGWIGALIGLVVATGLMRTFVVGGRFYR